jgi:hypothetical protein
MANFEVVHIETHDESKPAGSRARSLGDDDIREFKRCIRERLAVDHAFFDDESGHSNVGTHNKISFTEEQALDPTAYDDTGYLYMKDVGGKLELFWEDTDGNVIQLTSGGIIPGGSVLWPNNSYIAAKDAAGTGTVDLIKAGASDVPVLPDGAEMASDAAPTTDVQIPNKKYVDDEIAAIPAVTPVAFGAWASKSNNTSYQAATDGFVCATAASGSRTDVNGYTDAANPPTTLVQTDGDLPNNEGDKRRARSISFPVKKDDYWKVTGADNVYWIPLS